MLPSKELRILDAPAHPPVTQPTSRYTSPTRNLSFPPYNYASSPPSPNILTDALEPNLSLLESSDTNKSDDIDHQVKLALTELLNCSTVKADHEMRMWIQNRLMDTEHRIRARRRSRISSNAGLFEKRDSVYEADA